MKHTLFLISLVFLLNSCITNYAVYNRYRHRYVHYNRFDKSFAEADSAFNNTTYGKTISY